MIWFDINTIRYNMKMTILRKILFKFQYRDYKIFVFWMLWTVVIRDIILYTKYWFHLVFHTESEFTQCNLNFVSVWFNIFYIIFDYKIIGLISFWVQKWELKHVMTWFWFMFKIAMFPISPIPAGNPYLMERFIPVCTNWFMPAAFSSEYLIYPFYQTSYFNKEVICTEPSSSVDVPDYRFTKQPITSYDHRFTTRKILWNAGDKLY
jgi:hypothetical protein